MNAGDGTALRSITLDGTSIALKPSMRVAAQVSDALGGLIPAAQQALDCNIRSLAIITIIASRNVARVSMILGPEIEAMSLRIVAAGPLAIGQTLSRFVLDMAKGGVSGPKENASG